MFRLLKQYYPLFGLLSLALHITMCSGCSFEQDPEKTVTVEVNGISAESDREDVSETLKGMTDGSSHMMTWSSSGSKTTFNLSPVTDVKAFAKKINFGKVTEVKGRTIKVDFVE